MLITPQVLMDLEAMVSAAYQEGMLIAEPTYTQVASVINSSSSRNVYPTLSQWPGFRKWVGDREFANMSAGSYAIENETYENGVEIERERVEDNELGLFAHLVRAAGQATATHPDEMVYSTLANGFTATGPDGEVFFSDEHAGPGTSKQSNLVAGSGAPWVLVDTKKPLRPVIFQKRRDYALTSKINLQDDNVFHQKLYQWGIDARVATGYGPWMTAIGGKATLDAAAYKEAREKMASFRSIEGRPYHTLPTLLVVGPSNEAAARELLKAERTTGGKTNIWAGSCELLVTPYLV